MQQLKELVMKLHILSDLHLEFQSLEIENRNSANILILAGDICVAEYLDRSEASPKYAIARNWVHIFENAAAQYEHVIYVPGNHEHYYGLFTGTVNILRKHLGHISNLHILDNEIVELNGYWFVGTTLWTDFNRDSIGAKLVVQDSLNDYHLIKAEGYGKLRPNDTYAYHQKAISAISYAAINEKVIVVGHHAPSFQSVGLKYKNLGSVNYGYYSDLERFIDDRPNIKLWIHGHMHDSSDYMIGNTRIIANPRGYVTPRMIPENPSFDPYKVVEL